MPPQLLSTIKVTNKTPTSMTVEWKEWNKRTDFGDGPVIGYYLYCNSSGNMESCDTHSSRNSLQLSQTVYNLKAYTPYKFAVQLERPGDGGRGKLGPTFHDTTRCGGKTNYKGLKF